MMPSYCQGGVVNQSGFPPGLYNHMPCDATGVHFNSLAQLPIIIANIITILLAVIAVLAVAYVMYGAILYITSSGDSSKTAQAKNAILYAIVGVVLSGAAYLVVDFIAGRFS